MSDKNRILFLIDREHDPQKVVDFAVQARSQYRKAVLSFKRKYSTGGEYRKKYIQSYLFHKNFIGMNAE